MIWSAVAIDHWVTTQPNGQPVSLKCWPDGWVLARRHNRMRPALLFKSIRDAATYVMKGK